jgi:hypothetical protein
VTVLDTGLLYYTVYTTRIQFNYSSRIGIIRSNDQGFSQVKCLIG